MAGVLCLCIASNLDYNTHFVIYGITGGNRVKMAEHVVEDPTPPKEEAPAEYFVDKAPIFDEVDMPYMFLDERPCVLPIPEGVVMSRFVSSRINRLVAQGKITELSQETLKDLATQPAAISIEVLETMDMSNLDASTDKNQYLIKALSRVSGAKSALSQSKDDRVNELCLRTGYSLLLSSGYRQYGGPPPNWNDNPPVPKNCQVTYVFV